jgi:hypothetical protein
MDDASAFEHDGLARELQRKLRVLLDDDQAMPPVATSSRITVAIPAR